MEQDTGKFRKNTKDQYYTKASVAKHCVETILRYVHDASSYEWIEPSAGTGVFLDCLPSHLDRIGLDIDPKRSDIQKCNFLDWEPTAETKRIFFGNPPFGRQSCLAKAFLKHAAQYATILAFILPRSFVKPSMSRAIPQRFHCIHSEELQTNSFEVNGKEYEVPCVFQIWEKRDTDRPKVEAVQEKGFQYVKHGESFHIAFKRVGGLAGTCSPWNTGTTFNAQFHYFLKLEDIYVPHLPEIIARVNAHVFPSNTVGPRSLSKSEANEVLNEVLENAIQSIANRGQ